MIKSIIREPLFHFAVLGGLLFSAWSWVSPSTSAEGNKDTIVIDQSRLNHLETLWKAQWKRDPAPEDVAAIIDRHLRQEVFYREAINMGLDKDDDIIRTRLAQKMEAVASDLSSLMKPPTDAELRAFHQQRADLFTLPDAIAFEQILFLPSEMDSPESEQLLADLQVGGELPDDRLNKLSVSSDWELTSVQIINNSFGSDFSETLAQTPVGEWVGPIRSGLGYHLVRVRESEPAHLAPFDEIEEYVAQQYEYYAVLDAQKEMFQALLDRYQVQITANNVSEQIMQEYTQP
nr:peptidylprolyl isomerase [uncultured Vibrio sp.]